MLTRNIYSTLVTLALVRWLYYIPCVYFVFSIWVFYNGFIIRIHISGTHCLCLALEHIGSGILVDRFIIRRAEHFPFLDNKIGCPCYLCFACIWPFGELSRILKIDQFLVKYHHLGLRGWPWNRMVTHFYAFGGLSRLLLERALSIWPKLYWGLFLISQFYVRKVIFILLIYFSLDLISKIFIQVFFECWFAGRVFLNSGLRCLVVWSWGKIVGFSLV